MSDPKVLAVARDGFEGELPAQTPSGIPNVRVVVVSAVRVVVVRACRTYIQCLIGFLGATVAGVIPTDPLAPQDAWVKLATAAGLALYPAAISALQNILELLGKMDVKEPELRG